MKAIKNKKAPGLDGIPVEFYRNGSTNLKSEVSLLLKEIWETGNIPKRFQEAHIYSIYKKGWANDVKNYRGIAFLNALYKIFSRIIYNRLQKHIEGNDLLTESQFGFRKNHSTIDAIFTFTGIAQLKRKQGQKMYTCFIDLSAAFDTINRQKLMNKLQRLGLSDKIVNIIEGIYKHTYSTIWDGKNISQVFQTNLGVRQGCILSPLLFSIYLNDLNESIPGGVTINEKKNRKIKSVMYADDIAIIAETPDAMKLMLSKLSQYMEENDLRINVEKTKIMIFNKKGRTSKEENFWMVKKKMEVVNCYKYLGIQIQNSIRYEKNMEGREKKAKTSIAVAWRNIILNRNINFDIKEIVFYPRGE